jgi:hypothetical protein
MNAAYPFLALMEAVKLYLVASYTFLPLEKQLPLLPASLTLLGAFALSRILRATGGRLVFHVLAHALGLSLSFVASLTAYRGMPLISSSFFPVNYRELVVFLLVLGWTIVFWFRGLWLGACGKGARFCVARFDEGIAAFLLALSLAALMRIDNPASGRLVLPFMLFSSIALGMCRVDGVRRGGLSKRPRRLLVIPVAIVFLLASTAILALAPLLFAPAARLGKSIKDAYHDIEPGLVRFLRWLLGFYELPATASSTGSGANAKAVPIPTADDPRVDILVKILVWALGILAAAMLAALAAYGLYRLIRRLLAKVEKRGKGLAIPYLPTWLLAFFRDLARLSLALRTRLRQRVPERSAALAAYARLLHCGLRFGVRRKANETPREYATRLSERFPRSASGAAIVIDALEKEVYGSQIMDQETRRALIAIRRTTRSSAFLSERISGTVHGAMKAIRSARHDQS